MSMPISTPTSHSLAAGGEDVSRFGWCGPVVIAAIAWAGVCCVTIADPDLWGHTLYGLRAQSQDLLLERHDPFSYTAPGSAWTNHEWLAEYVFGMLWRLGGDRGLCWWRNGLMAVVFGVGAWAAHRQRAHLGGQLLLLLYAAICLSAFATYVRPQLATFALFATHLAVLRSHWDRPTRWAWLLPVSMVAWVNMHGGFLAGLGLHVIFCGAAIALAVIGRAESRGRGIHFATICGLTFLATLINPYGVELYSMLWNHLAPHQAVREWEPLWTHLQAPLHYLPFVLLLMALRGSTKWQWIDAIVLGIVAVQACMHLRHGALLTIAIMVLAPAAIADCLSRMFPLIAGRLRVASGPRRLLAAAAPIAAFIAIQVIGGLPIWLSGAYPWRVAVDCHSAAPGVPQRAVDVMQRERMSGNVITSYGWGQYLIWRRFPDNLVAFDGRYRTVYPTQLEQQFLTFFSVNDSSDGASRCDAMLNEYPTAISLLPTESPPAARVRRSSDWIVVYEDEQASLAVRRRREYAQLIRRVERGRIRQPASPRWRVFPSATPAAATTSATTSAPTSAADSGKPKLSAVSAR
ncbi:MAG: hypothetical protein CML07_08230 [Psychrobacter sp.]|nr:hypothetical protein [Psychrobacter sp.]